MKKNAIYPFLLPAILAWASFQNLQAQNQITGTIQNTEGKPLAYATVLLLDAKDSSLVRGTFSTDQGGFQFDDVAAGTFLCSFAMIGFEDAFSALIVFSEKAVQKNLDLVTLKDNNALLSEVTVIAKRPFLEQKIDRTIVNVSNSITNAGSTALQVLQRSPGVQVNALNKTISLSGKEGVVVMINGKIAELPADALVGMLSGMNSDNIDRIELIHTPPANFEAEGNAGIINIILKTTGEEGLNGGYSAKAGYGKGLKYGAGVYFNYRKNKVNLFGSYDHDFNLNPQAFTNYRGVQQGNDFLETDTYSDRSHTPTTTQNARLGLDYQMSKKTVIGVLGTFFDSNWYMEAVNSVKYLKNGVVDSLLRMPNTRPTTTSPFPGTSI